VKKAFIFGPFIGELYWEMYRFAPYAISLKKRFPDHKLIVFTRSRNFDLYGQYANIFIPLKIDSKYQEKKFTIDKFRVREYKWLCKYIKRKYNNTYDIVDHCAPQIEGFMYKVKWQYPRRYMNYSYKPRCGNSDIVNMLYGYLNNVVITNDENVKLENYNVVILNDFFEEVSQYCSKNTSQLGCLIEFLKKCKFVISNFDHTLAKIGTLCGVDVITVKEKMTDDAINLMNPLKIKVIKCNEIVEGVKIYEDSI